MCQHVKEFCGYSDAVTPSLKNRFLYFPFRSFTKAQRWQCCFETQNQRQYVTNVHRQILQSNLFKSTFHSDPLLERSPPCHHFSAVACRLHGRHAPWEELNPHILRLKKARTGEQEAGDLVMAPMGSELVVELLENRLVWVINGRELRRRSEGETCVARLCNLNTQYCRGSKRIQSIPWFGYSEFLIFILFGI